MKELELAIQFGKWVLVENIPDVLDPAIDPIISQQKIKDGPGKLWQCGFLNQIWRP